MEEGNGLVLAYTSECSPGGLSSFLASLLGWFRTTTYIEPLYQQICPNASIG